MMRLLTDENVPHPSVRLLREAGYDVESMTELFTNAEMNWIGRFTVADRERVRQRPLLSVS
jgi:hypothetical protein